MRSNGLASGARPKRDWISDMQREVSDDVTLDYNNSLQQERVSTLYHCLQLGTRFQVNEMFSSTTTMNRPDGKMTNIRVF